MKVVNECPQNDGHGSTNRLRKHYIKTKMVRVIVDVHDAR